MPFDGIIATPHLKDKVNTYFARGDVFALIVDDSKMTAEIDVPEMDVGRIKVGQRIYARPNANPDHDMREIVGELTMIDADVTEQPTGNYVKALAVLPNHDGLLTSGMTGYAKIDSPYLPVWKAFTLPIVRYFNIDVWSWIP
jgi:putative peptide zinc metalloprotease protein